MHNVVKTRWCVLADRNALTSLSRLSKPKNTAYVMDIQPETSGLGRTSCLSYYLLSSSLPTTKHTVFLIAEVRYVCHLVVFQLWNVEDQQVWYCFVLLLLLLTMEILLVVLKAVNFPQILLPCLGLSRML